MTARGKALLRHAAGLLVAPLVVPVAYVVIAVATVSADLPPGYRASVIRNELAVAAVGITPAAYAAAILLGVPLLLALRGVRRLTLPWVVAVSAVVAALASAGVASAWGCGYEECGEGCLWPVILGVSAALGAAVGLVHGLVAGVGPRPEAAPARPAPSSP